MYTIYLLCYFAQKTIRVCNTWRKLFGKHLHSSHLYQAFPEIHNQFWTDKVLSHYCHVSNNFAATEKYMTMPTGLC